MSRPSENDSRLYKHTNSSEASLSTVPLTLRQLLPRPRPPDDNLIDRVPLSPSSATSIETSDRGYPLYMRSTSYPAPTSAKESPRTRNRRSRQSLSLINNQSQSSPSLDDNDVAQKASQSLAREKMAWKVINREIAEWQNVCHTGRPSWWAPSSKGARRVQSQSSINRDLSSFGQSDWVDEDEYLYYPGLCFEFERRKDTAKDGQPWLQEMAYMIAVQLLSACFTLPVEQFSNCRMGIHLTYDMFGVPEMPDERLISALRLHTNYRWAPAFGHEARTTSPETRRSASYGGHTPYTPRKTPGVDSSPDVYDSSWRKKKKKQQHRARHVTRAETEHQQEYWEDTYEKAYGFGESPLITPTLGSWRDGSWRDRRSLAKSASYIPVPGRVVQSAPSTPRIAYRPPIPHRHTARSPRDEYPFPITAAVDVAKPARYSIQTHLQSEPYPVFVQPVEELVVKRWRTFRRRFGYSLSHGNPDNTTTTTNTTFTEERRAMTWGPPSPASLAPPPSHGVRRRRDAQSRHDIHSSSMESSPRYNTPNSAGTHSRTPSGAISPGILCAPPQSTPAVSEVDDLIAAARAITNSSSALPQEPPTASQPFPVFTPNNTPDHTDEENSAAHITRTEAGYFTPSSSPNVPGPTFVPKVKSRGKRRSGTGTRGSRRASSRLSEVYTQDEVTEEEQKYQSIQTAKHKLFDADTFSVLTTPTEESDSDGSKSRLRRGTVVVMRDPLPTSPLSPNLSALARMDSPTPGQLSNLSSTPLSPPMPITSPRPSSIASVDTDPFAFLSPRRDSPASGLPYSPGQVRPQRSSLSSMSKMSRNGSPTTQRRDSPLNLSPAVPDPWANRPSMSYTDRWAPPRISPVSMSRDDSRSLSTTYMSAIDRQPSTSPLPPTASDTFAETYIRSPRPMHSRSHLLSPPMSREDSRSSTASSPAVRPDAIRNGSNSALCICPQPPLPGIVRGYSRSSTAMNAPRLDLQRAVTSFPNIRPSMDCAALLWTNNSEDPGRRASRQSHRSMSSNDDAYDPHAVNCHHNLPSARGIQRGLETGSPAPGMKSTKMEPVPRKEAMEERRREVVAAEDRRSASVGAKPSTIRRSVSTPVVRPSNREYEEELRVGLGRIRLSRVSSSGTTHFSTLPEGIEVQGIPAGPDKEAWDEFGELTGSATEGSKRLGSSRRKKARDFL